MEPIHKKTMYLHRIIEESDYEPNLDQQPFPNLFPRSQSFTSLMADLSQDINNKHSFFI